MMGQSRAGTHASRPNAIDDKTMRTRCFMTVLLLRSACS